MPTAYDRKFRRQVYGGIAVLLISVMSTGYFTDKRSCERQETVRSAAVKRAEAARQSARQWLRYAEDLDRAGRQLDADHARRIYAAAVQRGKDEAQIQPLDCDGALPDTAGVG